MSAAGVLQGAVAVGIRSAEHSASKPRVEKYSYNTSCASLISGVEAVHRDIVAERTWTDLSKVRRYGWA